MDHNQLVLLQMIKAGLENTVCQCEDNIDWNMIYVTSYRQGIISIVYQAIKQSGLKIPPEYIRLFQVEALRAVKKDHLQRQWIQKICEAFDHQEILYLPLKGTVLKRLYPKSEYRWMSDADIYILQAQYPEIRPIMEKFGFVFLDESEHEIVWGRKDELKIELHKEILDPQYNVNGFFSHLVDEAVNNRTGNRLEWDLSQHLLYAVCHLAKHYLLGAGVNIRSLLDIHYLLQNPQIEMGYVNQHMAAIHMEKFFRILCDALDQWFHGKPFTEESEKVLCNLLDVSKESVDARLLTQVVAKEQKGNTKRTVWRKLADSVKAIFLPFKTMARVYPVLHKAPFFLPVFWFWRPIERLIKDPNHLKQFVNLSWQDQAMEKYMEEVKQLGLESLIVDHDENNK